MPMPVSDDTSLFQWIIGGIVTIFGIAVGFAFKRIDGVEKRIEGRIDDLSDDVDTGRQEDRKDGKADDDRLWSAVNTNRTAHEQRLADILTTMATKDDIRDLGRRLEAAISRSPAP